MLRLGGRERPVAGRTAGLGGWRSPLAWTLSLVIVAWTLMRMLGLDRVYPLVPIVAFTPYVAAASVLVLGTVAFLRVRAPIVLAAAAATMLTAITLPRAFGGGQAAAPEDGVQLTAMTLNLRFGNANAARVVELVRDADVELLSVQELTPAAVGRLRAAGLERLLPGIVRPAEEGASGGGLYATTSLVATGNVGRGKGGFRMPGARLRLAGGTTVAAVSVHPVPPTSSDAVRRWRDALRALPPAGEGPELGLLAGDFNATLDHRELRLVLGRGYVDAADATGQGLATTWSNSPWPALTIDHLLVDERIHVEATETHEVAGSDHKALVAELVLPANPG